MICKLHSANLSYVEFKFWLWYILAVDQAWLIHWASLVLSFLINKMVSKLYCWHTGWLLSSNRKIRDNSVRQRNIYTRQGESDRSYHYHPNWAKKEEDDVSCLGSMNFFSFSSLSLTQVSLTHSGLKKTHRIWNSSSVLMYRIGKCKDDTKLP